MTNQKDIYYLTRTINKMLTFPRYSKKKKLSNNIEMQNKTTEFKQHNREKISMLDFSKKNN